VSKGVQLTRTGAVPSSRLKLQKSCVSAPRFLNSTAAKWKFRAGDVEGAEATAALFTKDGDQVNNLYDMQCTWYEIESGRAWLRKSQYGKVTVKC
jgi:N-alpha-acetyltransferase 15/16, NatA auxiliary subunit